MEMVVVIGLGIMFLTMCFVPASLLIPCAFVFVVFSCIICNFIDGIER